MNKGNAQTLMFSSLFFCPPNDRRVGVSEGQISTHRLLDSLFLTASWTWDGTGWYGKMQHVNVLSPHAPVYLVEVARLAVGLCSTRIRVKHTARMLVGP